MKHPGIPRDFKDQNMWYYLPNAASIMKEDRTHLQIYKGACYWLNIAPVASIPARQLMTELWEAGIRPYKRGSYAKEAKAKRS